MSLKIAYIPCKNENSIKWGEKIMLDNLIANCSKNIEIKPFYDKWSCLNSDIDLVFLHTIPVKYRRWARGGARLERLIKRRILAIHTSDYDKFYEIKNRPRIIGGIRGNRGLELSKNYIKYFDAIHASNQYLMEKAYEYGAHQAYVLYPGVDMDLFKPMPELWPDTFKVGWAGDMTKPVKNVHLIKRLGYPFKIAIKENFIPHDKMPEFYNGLDVYVYFSTHEGCNRTILEAMACGLPVVSSNAGAVEHLLDPEWIVEGDPLEKEWLTRFRNKVEVLRNDPNLRNNVGKQNRENVSPWAWPHIAKRFEYICRIISPGGKYEP